MPVSLRAAACSDIGPVRTVNQDAAFAADWGAAVADGVGGGPAGEVASAALIHRLTSGGRYIRDDDDLRRRVQIGNWDIGAQGRQHPEFSGMATTLTGVWVSVDDQLLLGHTGDSRAYLLRAGTLTRMTRDDSLVQVLVERGLITAEEAGHHPNRNVITASLRGDAADSVYVSAVDYQAGDRWLLCSDGVSDYVPEEELRDLLETAPTVELAAEWIVRVANEAGTRDNVTAVVCDIVNEVAVRGDAAFAGAAAVLFTEDMAPDWRSA